MATKWHNIGRYYTTYLWGFEGKREKEFKRKYVETIKPKLNQRD